MLPFDRRKAEKHLRTLTRRREHLERKAHSPDEYTGRSWDLSEIAALNLACELISDYIAEGEDRCARELASTLQPESRPPL